jgi:beta-glucosidase
VAAVLAGGAPFTGRLPMPWYRSVKDIGKKNPKLLFDIGYGLN